MVLAMMHCAGLRGPSQPFLSSVVIPEPTPRPLMHNHNSYCISVVIPEPHPRPLQPKPNMTRNLQRTPPSASLPSGAPQQAPHPLTRRTGRQWASGCQGFLALALATTLALALAVTLALTVHTRGGNCTGDLHHNPSPNYTPNPYPDHRP